MQQHWLSDSSAGLLAPTLPNSLVEAGVGGKIKHGMQQHWFSDSTAVCSSVGFLILLLVFLILGFLMLQAYRLRNKQIQTKTKNIYN